MSKRLASNHRSAKRTHAFYFAARNASLAFLQFFLSLVDSFPTVLPRQYAEMRKKKVGILRTSGTSMFSGFLSVISDDSLCPHAEYSLSFFFFSALLQFMSPPLSKKEALTCCDAQYFSGRNLCRWKKMPSLRSLHFGSIFWWGGKPGNPRETLDSGWHWLKLNLRVIVGMRAVTDSHCASVTRAIFKVKTEKKNKVYSVYFIYVYSIYAVDVICWENPTKCMLYSTLRNAIMSFHQNSQSKQKRISCLLKDKRFSPFGDLLSLEGLLACCISCF